MFKEERYTQNNSSLVTRIRESNYPGLWNAIEITALGSGSSTLDYIMAAELAAAEKYTAGKDTVVAHTKTEGGHHGLVFPITGLTYDKSKADQQQTWGMDTDITEEKDIWNLGQTEGYPNRDTTIFTENEEISQYSNNSWALLAFEPVKGTNVSIEFNDSAVRNFEEFMKNPGSQRGMKYLDSICIAAELEEEAHPDGKYPELEDATLKIGDTGISYKIA